MRDVAIVSFAQAPLEQPPGMTETQMLLPTITDALERVGLTRRDVRFTCSGSADYLAGGTFTFVQMLEAAGAWPPISESHVEMDGAWALYEAWVRLQHGDVDIALVFASGRAGLSVSLRETLTLQLDPYYLVPLGADYVSWRRCRRKPCSPRPVAPKAISPRSSARSRRDARDNPNAAVSGDFTVDDLLAKDYVVAPLREHDIGPPVDGAAAVVLVAGDRARDSSSARRGSRASTTAPIRTTPVCATSSKSPSATTAGERAGCRQRRRRGRGAHRGLLARGAAARRRAGPGRRRQRQPVGRRARRQPDDGHGPRPHRRSVPPGAASTASNARSGTRQLGSVPATEPRLRPGRRGRLMAERCAVVGIGQTKLAKVPRRRVARGACAARPQCARSKTRR